MQTDNNNTNNNNTEQPEEEAPATIGDCARALVAAGLTPDQAPLLTFQTLLGTLRIRSLVVVAGRLFAAFTTMANVRHHGGVFSPPLELHTRTLLTAYLIYGHPVPIFERPTGPLEQVLRDATAVFLHTFGRLLLATAAEQPQLPLLPFELTAELLPQMAAFEAAHAAWTAVDVPRLVSRMHFNLVGLAQARAVAFANNDMELCAAIDTTITEVRGKLVRLAGGPEALAALDAGLLPPLFDDNNDTDDATTQQPEVA
jgi:hypothetical protein